MLYRRRIVAFAYGNLFGGMPVESLHFEGCIRLCDSTFKCKCEGKSHGSEGKKEIELKCKAVITRWNSAINFNKTYTSKLFCNIPF